MNPQHSFLPLRLIGVWQLFSAVALLTAIANGHPETSNEQPWDLPDAHAHIGVYFKYQLTHWFQNKELLITEAGKTELPTWLHFNKSSSVLEGVPLAFHEGFSYLQVFTKSTSEPALEDVFAINVMLPGVCSIASPGRNMMMKHDETDNSEGTQDGYGLHFCQPLEARFSVLLLLELKLDSTSAVQRINLLKNFSDFISKGPSEVTLLPKSGKFMDMLGDVIIIISSLDQENTLWTSQLSWHLACDSFTRKDDLAQVLDHNIKSGLLEKVLGYPVTGWLLLKWKPQGVSQTFLKRNRRQVDVSQTPYMTPTISKMLSSSSKSMHTSSLQTISLKSSMPTISSVFTDTATNILSISSNLMTALPSSSPYLTASSSHKRSQVTSFLHSMKYTSNSISSFLEKTRIIPSTTYQSVSKTTQSVSLSVMFIPSLHSTTVSKLTGTVTMGKYSPSPSFYTPTIPMMSSYLPSSDLISSHIEPTITPTTFHTRIATPDISDMSGKDSVSHLYSTCLKNSAESTFILPTNTLSTMVILTQTVPSINIKTTLLLLPSGTSSILQPSSPIATWQTVPMTANLTPTSNTQYDTIYIHASLTNSIVIGSLHSSTMHISQTPAVLTSTEDTKTETSYIFNTLSRLLSTYLQPSPSVSIETFTSQSSSFTLSTSKTSFRSFSSLEITHLHTSLLPTTVGTQAFDYITKTSSQHYSMIGESLSTTSSLVETSTPKSQPATSHQPSFTVSKETITSYISSGLAFTSLVSFNISQSSVKMTNTVSQYPHQSLSVTTAFRTNSIDFSTVVSSQQYSIIIETSTPSSTMYSTFVKFSPSSHIQSSTPASAVGSSIGQLSPDLQTSQIPSTNLVPSKSTLMSSWLISSTPFVSLSSVVSKLQTNNLNTSFTSFSPSLNQPTSAMLQPSTTQIALQPSRLTSGYVAPSASSLSHSPPATEINTQLVSEILTYSLPISSTAIERSTQSSLTSRLSQSLLLSFRSSSLFVQPRTSTSAHLFSTHSLEFSSSLHVVSTSTSFVSEVTPSPALTSVPTSLPVMHSSRSNTLISIYKSSVVSILPTFPYDTKRPSFPSHSTVLIHSSFNGLSSHTVSTFHSVSPTSLQSDGSKTPTTDIFSTITYSEITPLLLSSASSTLVFNTENVSLFLSNSRSNIQSTAMLSVTSSIAAVSSVPSLRSFSTIPVSMSHSTMTHSSSPSIAIQVPISQSSTTSGGTSNIISTLTETRLAPSSSSYGFINTLIAGTSSVLHSMSRQPVSEISSPELSSSVSSGTHTPMLSIPNTNHLQSSMPGQLSSPSFITVSSSSDMKTVSSSIIQATSDSSHKPTTTTFMTSSDQYIQTSTIRTPALTSLPTLTSSPVFTSPRTHRISASISSSLQPNLTGSRSSHVGSSNMSSSSQVLLNSPVPLGTTSVPIDDDVTTKSSTPEDPLLLNPIDLLVLRPGSIFQYSIPSDTFYDQSDGDTRNLSLSLLDDKYQRVAASLWIQLNQQNQFFFGVAVSQDLSNTVHHFYLTAVNSAGKLAYDALIVEIKPNEITYSHQFQVSLTYNFLTFHTNIRNLYHFGMRLVSFHENDVSSVDILSVRNGSVVVSYSNNSIPTSFCDYMNIEAVLNRMIYSNGSIMLEFQQAMGDMFSIKEVTINFSGKCSGFAPTISPAVTYSPQLGRTKLWISFSAGICAFLTLLFCILLICFCLRNKHPGEEFLLSEEKAVFARTRKPTILNDEKDVRRIPRRTHPSLLPDDLYPCTLPTNMKNVLPLQRLKPPNDSSLGGFMNPAYLKSPPWYSPNPEYRSSRIAPPQYQAPPPYYPPRNDKTYMETKFL